MQNPRTSIAGYVGLAGMVLAAIGQALPGKWSTVITSIGVVATGGAASLGNIVSKDGAP